jgi:hypothetical protein
MSKNSEEKKDGLSEVLSLPKVPPLEVDDGVAVIGARQHKRKVMSYIAQRLKDNPYFSPEFREHVNKQLDRHAPEFTGTPLSERIEATLPDEKVPFQLTIGTSGNGKTSITLQAIRRVVEIVGMEFMEELPEDLSKITEKTFLYKSLNMGGQMDISSLFGYPTLNKGVNQLQMLSYKTTLEAALATVNGIAKAHNSFSQVLETNHVDAHKNTTVEWSLPCDNPRLFQGASMILAEAVSAFKKNMPDVIPPSYTVTHENGHIRVRTTLPQACEDSMEILPHRMFSASKKAGFFYLLFDDLHSMQTHIQVGLLEFLQSGDLNGMFKLRPGGFVIGGCSNHGGEGNYAEQNELTVAAKSRSGLFKLVVSDEEFEEYMSEKYGNDYAISAFMKGAKFDTPSERIEPVLLRRTLEFACDAIKKLKDSMPGVPFKNMIEDEGCKNILLTDIAGLIPAQEASRYMGILQMHHELALPLVHALHASTAKTPTTCEALKTVITLDNETKTIGEFIKEKSNNGATTSNPLHAAFVHLYQGAIQQVCLADIKRYTPPADDEQKAEQVAAFDRLWRVLAPISLKPETQNAVIADVMDALRAHVVGKGTTLASAVLPGLVTSMRQTAQTDPEMMTERQMDAVKSVIAPQKAHKAKKGL